MFAKKYLSLAAFLALSGGIGVFCRAQYQIEPDTPRSRVYRIHLINETGQPLCLKLIGYGQSRYYHTDLRPGQSVVQDFYSGLRVLCMWNDDSAQLLVMDTVNINRNGKLRLRLLAMMAPKRAEGAEPGERAGEGPGLQIEEEN
jgi:hypothetical protein